MTRIRLHVATGEQNTTLDFRDLPIRIGRDESNECRLEFSFVSRSHARLEIRGDRLVVVDAGSSGGTWVGEGNGARLSSDEAVALDDVGNVFRIGSIVIRVEHPVTNDPRIATMAAPASMLAPMRDGQHARAPWVQTMEAPSDLILGRFVSVPMPALLTKHSGDIPELPALSDPGRPIGGLPREVRAATALLPSPIEGAGGIPKWLEDIDPERIERETGSAAGRSPLRFRALWEEYGRRYAEVVRRAREPPRDEGDEVSARAGTPDGGLDGGPRLD